MPLPRSAAAEVFSVREVARAAGVPADAVAALLNSGDVRAVRGFLPMAQSVLAVRLLRRAASGTGTRALFAPPPAERRSPAAAVAASSAFHGAALGLFALLTTLGLSPAEGVAPQRLDAPRLVFLATPGPGGGGGGGGLLQPEPPAQAELKGPAKIKSPLPPPRRLTTQKPEPRVRREPPTPRPLPRPAEPPPPPLRPAVTPQVVAPAAIALADPRDRAGVLSENAAETESQGPGSGAGAGTGQGTGIGEGSGAGVGPGTGGGTGGGPYRPGSGITPPELLKEVRPAFTDEARRQGIEGDVVLEIVVRSDGSVGDVKVLQGLGGGLNRNAIEAVRQWRFRPAQRQGTAVDVMVEVAVAFKLR